MTFGGSQGQPLATISRRRHASCFSHRGESRVFSGYRQSAYGRDRELQPEAKSFGSFFIGSSERYLMAKLTAFFGTMFIPLPPFRKAGRHSSLYLAIKGS